MYFDNYFNCETYISQVFHLTLSKICSQVVILQKKKKKNQQYLYQYLMKSESLKIGILFKLLCCYGIGTQTW